MRLPLLVGMAICLTIVATTTQAAETQTQAATEQQQPPVYGGQGYDQYGSEEMYPPSDIYNQQLNPPPVHPVYRGMPIPDQMSPMERYQHEVRFAQRQPRRPIRPMPYGIPVPHPHAYRSASYESDPSPRPFPPRFRQMNAGRAYQHYRGGHPALQQHRFTKSHPYPVPYPQAQPRMMSQYERPQPRPAPASTMPPMDEPDPLGDYPKPAHPHTRRGIMSTLLETNEQASSMYPKPPRQEPERVNKEPVLPDLPQPPITVPM